MRSIAILDLDGTILLENYLDVGLLEHLKKKFEHLVIVSNNSSTSHASIESLLSSFTCDVLTPQLLARSLVQSSDLITRICLSGTVGTYVKSGLYSLCHKNNSLWNQYLPYFPGLITQYLRSNKIGLVGKTSNHLVYQFIHECLLEDFSLVALNADRTTDSKGLSSQSPLLGDLYSFDTFLDKTSQFYLAMLRHFLQVHDFCPLFVFGDNSSTDRRLSELLDTEFSLTVFGESRFSHVVTVPEFTR